MGSWVSFLSDFGLEDALVGVCKGVVATIAPDCRIIDVCHNVGPQDVEHGAVTLAQALPYLPVGVHLAIVDPFQTAASRGVAVCTSAGSVLVSPDNGAVSLAMDVLGGATSAYEIANPDLWLPVPSPSCRARDVFAPVVGHLAAGTPVSAVGPAIDPATLVRVVLAEPTVDDDHVHAEIRTVDHFGNLGLNVRRSDLEAAGITIGDTVELRCDGRSLRLPFTLTYGDVAPGRVAVCEDSSRHVTVAVNLGHADQVLRARRGDALVISRLPTAVTRPNAPIGVYDPLPPGSTV